MEPVDLERSETAPRKKPTFKIIGNLVLAMKRFQAALNPTYDYGANKRSSSPTMNGLPKNRTASGPVNGRASSGAARKTMSGRPESAGKQHGYKGNLLFKPLPPLASEQATNA